MPETSRLTKMRVTNLGCIGPEGCEIALDSVLCLVGANNTGKSTFLRAYELALGTASFDVTTDLCCRAGEAPATVEIWVHIPEGMANIAEKWKERDGELRLVRSRWQWAKETSWMRVRATWAPETGEYSADDKASGLDTVFASRLPVPFRIGSLEDPEAEHKKLLTLVLQPIAERIQMQMGDAESDLRRTIAQVGELTKVPVAEENQRLEGLTTDLNKSHNAIFPDLKMDFDIGIGEVQIDPLQMLMKNSRLRFTDWLDEVTWRQQGTGSQRALFWTILQVRSRLKTIADITEQSRKAIAEHQKRIKKLQDEAEKVKKEETKAARLAEVVQLEQKIAALTQTKAEDLAKQQAQELSLPGYMLLIDEPEVALHPNAMRAACRYLYSLTDDRSWQVILATHSPLFINPLHDHTTIVRLARSEVNPTPRTYRSDSVGFSPDDKENLKMLNRFDQGLAEMFFGQLRVIVEGDTEYAAFEYLMNEYPNQFPLSRKPVLIRARGKHTMLLVMRILSEFRVPFAILHDADAPLRRDGKPNGAWTANVQIREAIDGIRRQGTRIVHRISIPGFEYAHFPLQRSEDGELVEPSSTDKPWWAVQAIRNIKEVEASVLSVLTDLTSAESAEAPFCGDFDKMLLTEVQSWARKNCPKDGRFGL
jgi:putative ATP-dependent endonuclease of the OLD family